MSLTFVENLPVTCRRRAFPDAVGHPQPTQEPSRPWFFGCGAGCCELERARRRREPHAHIWIRGRVTHAYGEVAQAAGDGSDIRFACQPTQHWTGVRQPDGPSPHRGAMVVKQPEFNGREQKWDGWPDDPLPPGDEGSKSADPPDGREAEKRQNTRCAERGAILRQQ